MVDRNHAEQLLSDATWLNRVAKSLVNDPATGEDLAQETWLAAVRSQSNRGESPSRSWLRTTLRSRLWNRRRQENSRRSIESDRMTSKDVTSPAELVERAELQERLAHALTELPEPLRTAALLRFLEGLSTSEIAARTDVAADTVRSRLRRAVDLLRSSLDECDGRVLGALVPAPGVIERLCSYTAQSAKNASSKLSATPAMSRLGGLIASKVYVTVFGLAMAAMALYAVMTAEPKPTSIVQGPTQASNGGFADLGPVKGRDVEIVALPELDERSKKRSAASRTSDVVLRVVTNDGRRVDNFPVSARLVGSSIRDVEYLWTNTDPDGLARFTREDVQRIWTQKPEASLSVGHHGMDEGSHMHVPVTVEIEPGEISDEPLEIEVDMMRIVVDAEGPDGTPWTDRHGISISPENYHYTSTTGEPPLVSWVPRAVGYRVRVYGLGLYEDVEENFAPPGAEESERTHTLRLAGMSPGIRGVIRYWDERAIPENAILRIVDRTRQGNGSRIARVAPDGSFEYPLKAGEEPGESRVFRFAVELGDFRDGIAATVAFVVPERGRWLDLGVLELERRPLLAAGRVITPDGIRARGMRVAVYSWTERGWWRHPELDNSVSVHEDGRFMVFGEDLPGPVQLRVGAGFRDDAQNLVSTRPLDIDPGVTGLEIRMVRAGGLRATVDLGDAAFRKAAEVAFYVRPDGTEHEFLLSSAPLPGGGQVAHDRIPPGRVRIELRDCEQGAVVREWSDIRVHEDATTDLGALALGDAPRTLELRWTEPPSGRVDVRYGSAGERPLSHRVRYDNGIARVIHSSAGLDVLILAEGREPVFVESVTEDLEIEMKPLPVARFELEGVGPLLAKYGGEEPRIDLGIRLEHAGYDRSDLLGPLDWERLDAKSYSSLWRPFERAMTVPVMAPGTYRVQVVLERWNDVLRQRRTVEGMLPSLEASPVTITRGSPSTVTLDLRDLLVPVEPVGHRQGVDAGSDRESHH